MTEDKSNGNNQVEDKHSGEPAEELQQDLSQELSGGPGAREGVETKTAEPALDSGSAEEQPSQPETAAQARQEFVNVVGVKFRRAGKTYYFDAGQLLFQIGEKVIVETDKGLGMGRVVTPVRPIPVSQLKEEIKRVVRKANWNDLQRDQKNKEREKEAFVFCQQRIRERNLNMKLVEVEYFHDASKAIFYFFAEQRVDFRELIKDLAHHLHTRIEMKQIGVRDESKLMGGLGNCGQPLCCSTFLLDFAPVSVRMAKDQCLAMNPAKVSGLCGRLMCCLSYEYPLYQEELKTLPKKGKRCSCPQGKGKVLDVNVLKRTCIVELESGTTITLPCEQIVPEEAPSAKPPQKSVKAKQKHKQQNTRTPKSNNEEKGNKNHHE